jgi:hypothetical protein
MFFNISSPGLLISRVKTHDPHSAFPKVYNPSSHVLPSEPNEYIRHPRSEQRARQVHMGPDAKSSNPIIEGTKVIPFKYKYKCAEMALTFVVYASDSCSLSLRTHIAQEFNDGSVVALIPYCMTSTYVCCSRLLSHEPHIWNVVE